MSEATQCSDCGGGIPPGQPKGLCPRCALKGALELSNGESQVLQTEDSANASPTQPVAPAGQLPTLKYFGDYELLEEIARGGMGIVYKARQASLDRIVAVKLLLRGEYASEDFIKRFRIEASAAASLQHPNIVAIHEVGVHEGHHYFAMDLVDGPNLARLLRDGPLPAKRAAGYVKTIAEAIHYAHEKGILHRDLKPSNVLIDANDQPRITDFGLAKRLGADSQPTTDLTQLTLSGHVLGSPGYMPPEQAIGARGKISRRSDVYSLGAMLYHLLTGQPPFGGGSVGETLKQVETQEPVSLRLLNASVPVDLETICLKCLEKDPERRYRSARVLSEELARFISDEPIQARPPSKLYRFRKLAQRNKLVFTAAAALVAALIAGTIVSTWQAARARRAVQVARNERESMEAVLKFFQDRVLSAGRPEELGKDVTLRMAIDAAESQIKESFQEQPLVEAAIRGTLRDGYHSLGEHDLAVQQGEQALVLRQQHLGHAHQVTLISMRKLGLAYQAAGKLDKALPLLEEVLKLCKANLGPEHPETLGSMAPLGDTYRRTGKLDKGLPLLEEAFKLCKTTLEPEHSYTLQSMFHLALAYRDAGKLDQALALLEEKLKYDKAKFGPDHPELLISVGALANLYSRVGKPDRALSLGEEVMALAKTKLGPDHPNVLTSMNNLAGIYLKLGKHDQALSLYEQALELRKAKLGPDHPNTLSSMHNLACTHRDAGKLDLAVALLSDTLQLRKDKLGPGHQDTLRTMSTLVDTYRRAGKLDLALPLLQDWLQLSKATLGATLAATHSEILPSMNALALAYRDAGMLDEAVPLLTDILQLEKAALGPKHADTQRTMAALENLLWRTKKFELLEPLYREQLAQQTGDFLPARFWLGRMLLELAKAESANPIRAQERAREGDQLLNAYLIAAHREYTNNPSKLDETLYQMAAFRYRLKDYKQAEPLYREILQSCTTRYPATNEAVASATLALAGMFHEWAWSERDAADKSEAVQHAREAEHLLRDCLATRAKTLRPGSSRLADTLARLGTALVAIAVLDSTLTSETRLAHFTEAESLLLRSHQTLQQSGTAEQYRRGALVGLVRLYEAWGKPEQLADWQQKLDALRAGKQESSSVAEE